MDPTSSALGRQHTHDPADQFSRRRRVKVSLGITALAKPDKRQPFITASLPTRSVLRKADKTLFSQCDDRPLTTGPASVGMLKMDN